jgi:hypothetical protein
MQLTIDTQKDSHSEIRKAIRMLMSLVGNKEVYTNEPPKDSIFDSDSSGPAANDFADMFNASQKGEVSESPSEKKKKLDLDLEFY